MILQLNVSRNFLDSLILVASPLITVQSDFLLHWSHAEEHEQAEENHDVHQNYLEVDPLLNVYVIFRHLGRGLVIEYGAVDYETDAEEVIHLKKQSKSALLSLEVDGVELDQLVQSMEWIVDEQEPVQEVVRANIGGIGKLLLVPDDITFEHGGVAG